MSMPSMFYPFTNKVIAVVKVVGKCEIDLSISGRFDFSQVCLKPG
jgi:hypothetical protein